MLGAVEKLRVSSVIKKRWLAKSENYTNNGSLKSSNLMLAIKLLKFISQIAVLVNLTKENVACTFSSDNKNKCHIHSS